MNIKTIWKKFFRKEKTLEEIWEAFEKGQPLKNAELIHIINILKERNELLIKENLNQKEYISQMQYGFDIAQKRLINKINSL